MAELQKKLTMLSKLGAELSKKEVTWAVGASLLLYLKGIMSAIFIISTEFKYHCRRCRNGDIIIN